MAHVATDNVLAIAAILFGLGLLGVLIRRDLVFVLMSLEILLNSAVLAFAAAGARWQQADGQIWVLFILVTAAAEVSVGLPLLLELNRRYDTVDTDALVSAVADGAQQPDEEEEASAEQAQGAATDRGAQAPAFAPPFVPAPPLEPGR